MSLLFTPLTVGALRLKNRILMAPLTRLRNTDPGDTPTALAALYYQQRASAGLIIAEATHISATAKGYAGAPGIYNDEQQAAWQNVTTAVHAAGGKIVLQLWHTGRISHRSLQAQGHSPLAPSALQANSETTIRSADGQLMRAPCDMPRAMTLDEIAKLIVDYREATLRAQAAGFDGVEIHAAHGYLLHQFLSPDANQRTDSYGGNLKNRARLVLEVVDTVSAAWDAGHVGIRLSPLGVFNGLSDIGQETMAYALFSELAPRKLAYLHISEPDWAGAPALSSAFRQQMRHLYPSVIIAAGNYDIVKATTLIEQGLIDAVAFGRKFIANADLVERLESGLALNEPDPSTFYGGGAKGYTEY